jgi:hypothetical protein
MIDEISGKKLRKNGILSCTTTLDCMPIFFKNRCSPSEEPMASPSGFLCGTIATCLLFLSCWIMSVDIEVVNLLKFK